MNYFHLKNSTEDYTTTKNIYSTEFQDLGVTYKDIAKYMNNEELDEEILKKIERLHNNNKHKFNIPTYRRDEE